MIKTGERGTSSTTTAYTPTYKYGNETRIINIPKCKESHDNIERVQYMPPTNYLLRFVFVYARLPNYTINFHAYIIRHFLYSRLLHITPFISFIHSLTHTWPSKSTDIVILTLIDWSIDSYMSILLVTNMHCLQWKG